MKAVDERIVEASYHKEFAAGKTANDVEINKQTEKGKHVETEYMPMLKKFKTMDYLNNVQSSDELLKRVEDLETVGSLRTPKAERTLWRRV